MLYRLSLSTALFLTATLAAQEKPSISLQVVKFPELVKAIQAYRGRVVVVDFWANY